MRQPYGRQHLIGHVPAALTEHFEVMTKRALVTGAGGFVGSALTSALQCRGWRCIAAVRRQTGGDSEVVLDFEDPSISKKVAATPRCDAIIHLASHVDFSNEAAPADFFATNILASSLLCHLARNWNAHLVLASGTLVFGKTSFVDASSVPAPDTPYAAAKWLCEQIVEQAGIAHTILRIGGIIGRRGPRHLGLNRTIDAALDLRKIPTLVGGAPARRNYVYVHDLAETIVECVTNRTLGTHLVAGRQTLTMQEMLQSVCDVFLPGQSPEQLEGVGSPDMIVRPSDALPSGRSFQAALEDIRIREGRHTDPAAERSS